MLFVKLAESSKKRRRELEKAAMESVDHSLLEPISGFTDEAYPVGIVFSLEMSDDDILARKGNRSGSIANCEWAYSASPCIFFGEEYALYRR